ncbi:MAG: SRPBCC domain-containing protein [Hyphomicrobiaceae bacterium]|nr:SRPBCC domain-containing protein [Hyphomicrobiaceae bacterium]
MSALATHHRTVVLARTFEVPVTRLYAALSLADERARSASVGEDIHVVLDEVDFRVGGHDLLRFGPWGHPRFTVLSTYHDIVPERRIVSCDVVSERGTPVSVAVATIELKPLGHRCQLKLTAQLVALHDPDRLEGADVYYETLLANLGRYLADVVRLDGRPGSVR